MKAGSPVCFLCPEKWMHYLMSLLNDPASANKSQVTNVLLEAGHAVVSQSVNMGVLQNNWSYQSS